MGLVREAHLVTLPGALSEVEGAVHCCVVAAALLFIPLVVDYRCHGALALLLPSISAETPLRLRCLVDCRRTTTLELSTFAFGVSRWPRATSPTMIFLTSSALIGILCIRFPNYREIPFFFLICYYTLRSTALSN